jgi:hypothetical protein
MKAGIRFGVGALVCAVSLAAIAGDARAASTTYASVIALDTNGAVYVEELTKTAGCSSVLTESRVSHVGTVTNLLADIDGDGLSDLVEWNAATVYVSFGQVDLAGTALFSGENRLLNQTFSGNVANLVYDANGDGYQDLIAWNTNSIYYAAGNGRSSFSAPALLSSYTFYGQKANTLGDVNADGAPDFIAWDNGSMWVMASGSSGYSAPTEWLNGGFYGSVANLNGFYATHYNNLNIAWNSSSIWVTDSNSCLCSFGTPSQAGSGSFSGSQANLAVDVNLDGYTDLVAVNASNMKVELFNTTGGYGTSATTWCTNTFYGSEATLAGYTAR